MSLNAIIPPGVTELTVNGLTQWDYGQKLRIYSNELPDLLEVHFACFGMEEAIVRACSCTEGVVEAAIPDDCLEQTTPVTAWVYGVGTTSGETLVTITMPIVARTKPQVGATIPEEISDKYTEAVGAMNALVEATEEARAENVETLHGIIAEFNRNLSAAPRLNEARQLTEGPGFYYVMLYEKGSKHYCCGMIYWQEGVDSVLPTLTEYQLEYGGVYRLDAWVDYQGYVHIYQRNTSTSNEETRTEVTNAWGIYTKKFGG